MSQHQPAIRTFGWIIGLLGIAILGVGSTSAQPAFPFEHELLLDAAPMRGSKRVPSLDIAADGAAEIVLWCNTVRARLIVAGDTVTVLIGPRTERQCAPEIMAADEALVGALTEATNWRRQDDLLVLTGGRTVRFRFQTN